MGGHYSYPKLDLSTKTVIVTGANSGIGFETAKQLSMMGAKVILACRSEHRAEQAITKMKTEYIDRQTQDTQLNMMKTRKSYNFLNDQSNPDDLNLAYMNLDLSSLKSTMDFINNFKMKECSLNILICNAGISCPPKELTEDGFEQQFQVNYLSHLLLTLHLMPILIASGPGSRIVNVSSMSYLRGEFDLGNIQGQQLYDRLKCYGNSKLYQIMSMFCLQRRLDDSEVTVTSLHPGSVDTNIAQSFQDHWFQYIYKGYRNLGLFIDAEKAAAACIDVAVNPEYDGVSGTYFEHGKRKIPSALSRSVKKQEELWEYSMQCLKGYYQQRGYLIW